MEYISYEELDSLMPLYNKATSNPYIATTDEFSVKLNNRKIKEQDFRKLLNKYPNLLFRHLLKYVDITPDFLIKIISSGYYSYELLKMENIKCLMNDEKVINLLVDWADQPIKYAFFRSVDLKNITNENAKKILDKNPIIITKVKNSNAELDEYAFNKMNEKQRSTNFLYLSVIDRAIFYGDLSGINNIHDKDFLLFTVKTVLILSSIPTYNEQSVNVQKLHLHLLEREDTKGLFKQANFELKLDPDLREDIISGLLPF